MSFQVLKPAHAPAYEKAVNAFLDQIEKISQNFFTRPLSRMQPKDVSEPGETISRIADAIERAAELIK